MFELKICGIFEAGRWAENGWPTHIISMVDPGVQILFSCENHLVLHLHDVESQLMESWVLPNEHHLDSILEFSKDLQDGDRLLVHCHQGISRSTSAAIGIMIQHGMDAEAAYRHVESVRDILLPNGLITRMIDNRFGLNNALIDLTMGERRAKMQTRMDRSIDANDHGNVVEMKSILEKFRNIR
jgi:predicted protein tyrosine phosphatase